MFFRAAAEIARVRPIIVNGDPAGLTKLVAAGEIDALWQGAMAPIPSLTEVANLSDAVIFGLSDADLAAVLKTFPQLSATTVPPPGDALCFFLQLGIACALAARVPENEHTIAATP